MTSSDSCKQLRLVWPLLGARRGRLGTAMTSRVMPLSTNTGKSPVLTGCSSSFLRVPAGGCGMRRSKSSHYLCRTLSKGAKLNEARNLEKMPQGRDSD
ncbi:MAG: hypothetical protein BJ554DRAFT_3716 [Olpidium bornovanus]|uniref:Uncharacterized protein n=1 Tax=Olpidium bornovanus TaxID=278681 RepID=A0A8H7ZND7_9FUNG|nr:MAG: hypothetical protein BJ554DRAFT_3716 [Olpidium bornovanus]